MASYLNQQSQRPFNHLHDLLPLWPHVIIFSCHTAICQRWGTTGLCTGCSLHRNVLSPDICLTYSFSYFRSPPTSPSWLGVLWPPYLSETCPSKTGTPHFLPSWFLFFSTAFAFIYYICHIFIVYLSLVECKIYESRDLSILCSAVHILSVPLYSRYTTDTCWVNKWTKRNIRTSDWRKICMAEAQINGEWYTKWGWRGRKGPEDTRLYKEILLLR